MTCLSVNINKIATLRNSRGGDYPNVCNVAKDVQHFGAHGITVHPRPDERHIRYNDVYELKEIVYKEFNIEGNPIDKFVKMVTEIKPTQVTLVPDDINALTSNAGWDTIKNETYLKEIVDEFKSNKIRTSIFLDPKIELLESVININPDRVELYTEEYAKGFAKKKYEVINKHGIGINAGHDLSLSNIKFFKNRIENLIEVSIGHALIGESLYFGLEETIKKYLYHLS